MRILWTIGLHGLRARHWAQRQWIAACYAVRLHVDMERVRVKLVRKFGADWVAAELPKMTQTDLARSTWRLLHLAADPNIDRIYRQRTARWKACLRKLAALRTVEYAVTEPAGRRVYYAALRYALSELAGQPVAVPELSGPLRGNLTSAIIRWLESAGLEMAPLVVAVPLGSSAVDPLESASLDGPTAPTTPFPRQEVRGDALRQQYASIHASALQELHAAYLRCRLAHLAIAQALTVTVPPVDASSR